MFSDSVFAPKLNQPAEKWTSPRPPVNGYPERKFASGTCGWVDARQFAAAILSERGLPAQSRGKPDGLDTSIDPAYEFPIRIRTTWEGAECQATPVQLVSPGEGVQSGSPAGRASRGYPPNAEQPDCHNQWHNFALTAARSMHPGGVQVGLCDGSARFVSETVDLVIWRALATRAGGEVVGEP